MRRAGSPLLATSESDSSDKPLICEDPVSLALEARIACIAPSAAPVLITGETGTGKELIARRIHAQSGRAAARFVAFNAGAMSETLAESELFGHERGAFTGASNPKIGWFQAAHGGTLFLDEVGDLPHALQVKLLRVLQEGEVTPVGSRTPIKVDVRVIAATNVDLPAAIRAKQFREDLYYRLNVASLALKPLRERPLDILPLARHFIAHYAAKLNRGDVRLGPCAAQRLLSHPFPGNVRELENAVHNALLVGRSEQLLASDFELVEMARAHDPELETSAELKALERAILGLLERGVSDLHERVESTLFTTAYHYAEQNQLETGRLLGLSRNVVRARLIEHGCVEGVVRRTQPAKPALLPASYGARPALPKGPKTVRIGYQRLGLLMVAKAHGALDTALCQLGVTLDWVEYADGIEIVQALGDGTLAAGIVGDCPAVLAQAQAAPIVYLGAERPAPRGTALVVHEDSKIDYLRDLRGKRVAVSRASQAHYLLLRALEEEAVDPRDVEICFAPPEQAYAAFCANAIDAWGIWDPWLSIARLESGARILRDSSGLLTSSAYYLARRDFADEQPALISELLRQLAELASWIRADKVRAAYALAPRLGMSARALLASFSRDLELGPLTDEQIASQQEMAERLLRLQLLSRPVSVMAAQWQP